MKNKNNNKRMMKNTSIILFTCLLYACGGSGETDTGSTINKPLPVATSATCAKAALASDSSCITINGRESIFYEPNNQLNDGIAIFLHGSPGSAEKVMNIFAAKELATQYNLIALAPEGTTPVWGWQSINTEDGDNIDIEYITELLVKVRGDYNVSSDKLYIFGYSAGGFMAYKLACNLSEQVSAIVSLAGQYRGKFSACGSTTPVSIHHFHSRSDEQVPYQGRDFGAIQAVEDTIEHWRNKNGCDQTKTSTSQTGVTSTSTDTYTDSYQNCLKSVKLSKMLNVPHEAEYQSKSLLEIYAHIFIQE